MPFLLVLFAAPLTAQVPRDYLVLAEGDRGITLVEPATGLASSLRPHTTVKTVAVSPPDEQRLFFAHLPIDNWSFRCGTLRGSRLTDISGGQLRDIITRVASDSSDPSKVWFTWEVDGRGGLSNSTCSDPNFSEFLLFENPTDLAVTPNAVFANSYAPGVRTDLVEWTDRPRWVARNYPPFHSFALLPGQGLLAGTDFGDLLLIDPTTGGYSLYQSTGKGRITTVGVDASMEVYFSTAANVIWKLSDLSTPIYRSPGTIYDFDIGQNDQGSVLTFVDGCPAVGPPFVDFAGGLPSLGNSSFSLHVLQARALTNGALMIGASRTMFGSFELPLDLSVFGLPGCTLYTDIRLALPVNTDNVGTGDVSMSIPNQPSFVGVHVIGQFFLADPYGPPPKVMSSDGVELILR